MSEEQKSARKIYEQFRMPFPVESIKWRLGATNKRQTNPDPPTRGKPLPYIESRDVMARLDETVGFQNWDSEMTPGADGIMVCSLGVKIGGEWVRKADVAGETGQHGNFDKSDSQKGSGSDAFKRAGVQWHIARYLYWISPGWVDLVDGNLPEKKVLDALLPSWASPAGWKREVLKLDGNPLSEQERLDLETLLGDYRKEKKPETVAAVLKKLGYSSNTHVWTTGMVSKFTEAIGKH